MLKAAAILVCWIGCLAAASVAFAQDLPEMPPAPWVREDVTRLEELLRQATDLLPAAEEAVKSARSELDRADLPPAEKPAREAALAEATRRRDTLRERADACRAALQAARQGPTAAQLQARVEFERLVEIARSTRAALMPGTDPASGGLARAIAGAEEELAHRAGLSDAVDKNDVRASRVYERLSDVEKLEVELRWATERFKVKVDEYDQLAGPVFAAYVAFEDAALAALAALDSARGQRVGFAGTPAADLPLPGQPATEQELAQLAREIETALSTRRGSRNAADGQLLALEGRLREIQRAIDLREDYREALELDIEKLKDRLARQGRAPAPAANAPAVAEPQPTEDYQRLSRVMDDLEAEMQSARAESAQLRSERDGLARWLAAKQAVEREVEAELATRTRELQQARAATDRPRRAMLEFTREELAAAVAERLAAARTDTRRVHTQMDVVDRRLATLAARIAEIETAMLPQTRQQYWRSLADTAARRGGRILAVFAVAWLLLWLIKRLGTPVLERAMRRNDAGDGSDAYRRQRSRTLFAVFMTTTRVIVLLLALMFALAQFDVDYGPLLVAAGGVSLALGFGAQSLVKDFFSGFFILLEGQYSIGDVIEINGKSGTVENLNLRTTVLRSVNGDVHTIPNGVITMTTNQTKIWSRAVMDVGVAYEENLDDVIALLEAVGREMQQDPVWGRRVQDIIIPGVDSFGDNSVNIRVLLKTRAGEQWGAAREYRRRLKQKFDEFGVEIPWPQRVVTSKEKTPRDGEARRKARAALLRYARRMRGEKDADDPALSVEERDRAGILARAEVQAGNPAGVPAPQTMPAPEAPRPPLTDAERLARELAERDRQDEPKPPPRA